MLCKNGKVHKMCRALKTNFGSHPFKAPLMLRLSGGVEKWTRCIIVERVISCIIAMELKYSNMFYYCQTATESYLSATH